MSDFGEKPFGTVARETLEESLRIADKRILNLPNGRTSYEMGIELFTHMKELNRKIVRCFDDTDGYRSTAFTNNNFHPFAVLAKIAAWRGELVDIDFIEKSGDTLWVPKPGAAEVVNNAQTAMQGVLPVVQEIMDWPVQLEDLAKTINGHSQRNNTVPGTTANLLKGLRKFEATALEPDRIKGMGSLMILGSVAEISGMQLSIGFTPVAEV